MDKFFKLKASNTNIKTEILAGCTTFFTMVYIIFVNPRILSAADMPSDAVFIATIFAAVIGTLVMGFVANVPYAQAPGMGLNAFFAFTVCGTMGFVWQEALALVFICGLINIVLTVTKIRKVIIRSIPPSLQNAIGGGIGIFIAYIGLKSAGFLTFIADPGTFFVADSGTAIIDSSIVPELSTFNNSGMILALIGLIVTIILLVKKVHGSIFIGIVFTTILAIITGNVSLAGVKFFDFKSISALSQTSFSLFGNPGLGSMFDSPGKIFLSITAIFAFSLSDTFDTIGTFIGTGKVSGIFDDKDEQALMDGNGFKSKMDKALFADATATSIGALLGTSNTTTYVESAAGINVGGRTGLTSITVAILFLLCLPFSGLLGIVPAQATAPALIIVGAMMMSSFADIKWKEFTEAVPAFITVAVMAFAYNISYGIAAGFIFFCVVKFSQKKFNEVHPILLGATVLFILNFIILALRAAGIF